MWRDLFRGNQIYHRGLLYRKHIFNPYVYYKIVRNDYTLVFLFLAILTFAFIKISYLMILYFLLICIKSLVISKRKSNNVFSQFFYFLLRDFMNLCGFFSFFPKKIKKIEYESVL